MRPPDGPPQAPYPGAQRWPVLAGLTVLTGIALLETGWVARSMGQPDSALFLAPMAPWGTAELAVVMLMWMAMMVAMMTPSIAPMVTVFLQLTRRRRRSAPWLATAAFVGGYLLVWCGFSVLAALLQWGLRSAALLQPGVRLASPALAGALLLAAGLYQWSAAKSACLHHCRSPMGFLLNEWRDGPAGALVMGLRHGVYCTGCCALLMALLFVVGTMNILGCAALALLVIAEKWLPGGLWIARATGAALIAWGLWMFLAAVS